MAKQVIAAPQRRRPDRTEEPEFEEPATVRPTADEVIDSIDELLDEIDSVLEEQSVLLNFRQRSGQ